MKPEKDLQFTAKKSIQSTSQSTSKTTVQTTVQKGQAAELYIRHCLERWGSEILGQNIRTPFAQVDLLVRTTALSSSPNGLYIAEVKLIKQHQLESLRPQSVGWKQRQRLLAAANYLEEIWQAPVGIVFIQVQADGRVRTQVWIQC